MSTGNEPKKKPGDIYVVTNNCFKEVEAKGRYKGRGKVAPVKIGRGVEFENRVGSLSAAVCDDFIFHLVLYSDNSVQSEAELHDKFGDSRLRTTCKCSTEFFAAPMGDVLKRIRKFAKGNGLEIKHDFGVAGRALGSSACSIKAALKKLESCNVKCGVKTPKTHGKANDHAPIMNCPDGDVIVSFVSKGIDARGVRHHDGSVTVFAGQRIVPTLVPSAIGKATDTLRKKLSAEGIIKNNMFTRDFTFAKASPAASVIVGSGVNGNAVWKVSGR